MLLALVLAYISIYIYIYIYHTEGGVICHFQTGTTTAVSARVRRRHLEAPGGLLNNIRGPSRLRLKQKKKKKTNHMDNIIRDHEGKSPSPGLARCGRRWGGEAVRR